MTAKPESAEVPGTGVVTRLLDEMRQGDPEAAGELWSPVYRQLRALAAYKMAHEAPGQTLQPTALVHEAWLRLGGGEGTVGRAWAFTRGRLFCEIQSRKAPSGISCKYLRGIAGEWRR